MEYARWYDNTPNLKELFEFIEGLENSIQKKLAQDIIQCLLSDFKLDLDKELNTIIKNYTYECNRWYDNDISLFTSFEIIRNLSIELQQKIIEKIIKSILLIYAKGENEKEYSYNRSIKRYW